MKDNSLTVNQRVEPLTAAVNEKNHLTLGGIDVVELAAEFGTPLWIICEDTIRAAAQAIWEGLKDYPSATPSYAGKAFLCLAMAALVKDLNFGIDVVSEGELVTALQAGFSPDKIFLHGNNKSLEELTMAISNAGVKIVVDSLSELEDIIDLAQRYKRRVPVMLRIIPGIDLDTHDHIKTGHSTSKFGIPLDELERTVEMALEHKEHINLLGLHAHIGSQGMDLPPYLQVVELMGDLYKSYKDKFGYEMPHLDLGGGLGIAYIAEDRPIALNTWARTLSDEVKRVFPARGLNLPELSLEPGRSIIGTAGVTLYQVGRTKELAGGVNYLSIDGGMADNPRPIMYQAKYTAVVANRMTSEQNSGDKVWSIVGRYCESGDIIVEEVKLNAKRGDLIAIFATGAYNYSMSSNYNRTARPACVLVKNGKAEVILARETCTDLLRQDRMPSWLA
ncbi:MAG: diaminopimelate decarboxylase [Cyanobacteria bacterium SZAS LIN-2]|nr:diaminopimelate decarboxylase [Cyanobacteria bacterium SZAS LIN-2]